ncbi:MAG: hypothetical protein ACI87T_002738, partial [Planctomycetota bacterium]
GMRDSILLAPEVMRVSPRSIPAPLVGGFSPPLCRVAVRAPRGPLSRATPFMRLALGA